jgi:16S rRNA (adenine1518-N6/adenine1519-N6)-dimethyltransferase
MARQRLGQHFLSDLNWREEIARAIRVSPYSTMPLPHASLHASFCWIEIGAGHGEMTEHLLSTGAPVYAIEIDKPLIAGLERLAKRHPNLTVLPIDVLSADIASIAAGRRAFIYGNLPYYITSPILQHLFAFSSVIDELHIVIQTEVALRLAAQPGTRDYGYLSVLTQLYSRPEFIFDIPKSAFTPPPEVSSSLVTLRFPGIRAQLHLEPSQAPATAHDAASFTAAESRFLDFVKLCFAQKRKTLSNNLKTLAKPDAIRASLASLSIRPDARAEQLSVNDFAALYSSLVNRQP